MRRERGKQAAGAAPGGARGAAKGKGPGRAPAEGEAAAGWRWLDLLGEAAEGLPADLSRGLPGRRVERQLAELPGFRVETGEDGLRWIVGRLPLGGIGAALAAANFVWMLVYHLGAPAVVLVRVSSAGELQVDVR